MTRFEQLGSGDIILYSGRHPVHLRQQEVTGCPWSQVGLVLRPSNYSQAFVLESTKLSNCRDIKIGRIFHSVQIARLDNRVDSLEGRVAVRQVFPRLTSRVVVRLNHFAEQVHGIPFGLPPHSSRQAALPSTLSL